MLAGFAEELRARRGAIKDAWERRLRREPVTSPLANPDTLVMMMDSTLDEFFLAVEHCESASGEDKWRRSRDSTGCLCGLNPLLAYFRSLAATICALATSESGPCSRGKPEANVQCLARSMEILRAIARRDIAAFCAVCQSEISVGQRRDISQR